MNQLFERYNNWLKKGEDLSRRLIQGIKVNKNLPIFLVFLFISTIFWLLKSLNKEYETYIEIPIKYTNLPESKVLLNHLPDHLKIEIKDEGFTVMRYVTTKPFYPIVLNVEKQVAKHKRNDFLIRTTNWENDIVRQFSSGTDIVKIYPDTIAFHFSDLAQKKIAIRPNVSVKLGPQRIMSGKLVIQPDSIMVHGSRNIIDTLQFITTEKLIFSNVTDSIKRNIVLPDKRGLKYSHKRVLLQIPVEAFTEKKMQIPVTAVNAPDSLFIRSFPGKVTVKCFVGLSRYNEIGEEDFAAHIDYSNLKGQADGQASVIISCIAPFISDVQVQPKLVDYLVEVK